MANTASKYTVLIVDDTPDNLQLLSNILYQKGINISIAQSGRQSLNIVARKPPDLVLLDILMPEMDGFEVCEHFKRDPATKEIPIIFLTAKTRAEDIIKGFDLGAVDYITKPFNPAEVVSRVFTHLELKRSRDLIRAQNQQLEEQNTQLKQQNREIQELHALKERKSEQQYRLLVKNVADGIGIIQNGKLVFVNEALASMLGFTTEQLIGKSPVDLFHKKYKAQFRKMYQQLEQGNPDPQSWPVLQCIVSGENREIWIEGRQSVITWEGKPAILMDMRDITSHRLREMAIEEERELFRKQNLQLRASLKERYRFGDIIGKSQVMQEVYELIIKAAASQKDVVICGESGTGKELIAQTIHQLSGRQDNAFVSVNCGAIQETLFEREFFGHRKGAFTGADRDKQGFFDAAHNGTLFLDEVGELNLAMQVKLLRAIESGEYIPIGESHPKRTDVRIIAATQKNLTEQVERGTMRDDFFYRIHVIVISVPPLRDRKEDIPLLLDHFLKQCTEGETPPTLPGSILEALYNHHWPGNIRQLQNVLYRYLTIGHLDFTSPRSPEDGHHLRGGVHLDSNLSQQGLKLHEAVEQLEKEVILRTLEQHRWHRTNAAAALDIPRRSLLRKMKKYGLT